MGSIAAANRDLLRMQFRPGERRKNPRFAMQFSVFLRALGGAWACTETADISAAGAFFVTESPISLHAPIEYILTFPPELTKAPQRLRMRFCASVVRCERIPGRTGSFGVAVRHTAHRYLTREEAAGFDALDEPLSCAAAITEAVAEPTPTS